MILPSYWEIYQELAAPVFLTCNLVYNTHYIFIHFFIFSPSFFFPSFIFACMTCEFVFAWDGNVLAPFFSPTGNTIIVIRKCVCGYTKKVPTFIYMYTYSVLCGKKKCCPTGDTICLNIFYIHCGDRMRWILDTVAKKSICPSSF